MQLETTEPFTIIDTAMPIIPTNEQPNPDTAFQEETPQVAEKTDGGKEEEDDDGQAQRKVGSFYWKRYNPLETKEINYIADFLKENEGTNILRKKLGLSSGVEGEKVGVKKPASFTFNSSNARIMDVADNIMNRLVNLGGLDEDKNIIKRKRHNNENYYEQDEFIDDQVEGCRIQQFMSKYEDFFAFEGSKEEFMMSARYQSRMSEINSMVASKKIKKAIKRSKPIDKSNPSRSPTKKPKLTTEDIKKVKKINIGDAPKKPTHQVELMSFFKSAQNSRTGLEKKSTPNTPPNESTAPINTMNEILGTNQNQNDLVMNQQHVLSAKSFTSEIKRGVDLLHISKVEMSTSEKGDIEIVSEIPKRPIS
jgi:hypothetical protein